LLSQNNTPPNTRSFSQSRLAFHESYPRFRTTSTQTPASTRSLSHRIYPSLNAPHYPHPKFHLGPFLIGLSKKTVPDAPQRYHNSLSLPNSRSFPKSMSQHHNRRIAKEIQDVHNDPKCHVTVEALEDDMINLHGKFVGPPDTPYEGGKYEVEIKISNEYPFKPPEMRFITKIWHPNISSQTVRLMVDCVTDILIRTHRGRSV